MEPTDLTVAVLIEIRDEIRTTNSHLYSTRTELKGEISGLRAEFRGELSDMKRRLVESEVRTATAITDLGGTLREVRDLLRDQHDLRPRLERCEKDIVELRTRLDG